MIIEQLSVFIENKSGRLYEVMAVLGDNNINVSALSIADTSDYGIVRMIVTDPHKAKALLKEHEFSVKLVPVICCKTPNQPGGLKRLLSCLSEDQISLEYMYAFSANEDACIILKIADCNKAIESLSRHQMELICASDIYQV